MRAAIKARRATGRAGGFTFIEILCVVALAALLALVAYPAYEGALHRTRRAEALSALLRLQLAQERHRANHARYATLAELGLPGVTPRGHYSLAVAAAGPAGYQLVASAQGAQGADRDCRHLKLSVAAGDISHSSGPDPLTANPDALNRRCWGL